jgi:hypothetical protein
MHGEDPDIAPHFASPAKLGVLPLPDPIFWRYTENPAKVSQTTRARQALFQIEQGLNVYGYRDDMVPVLRYKPLKQAADLFATSAKSAQNACRRPCAGLPAPTACLPISPSSKRTASRVFASPLR